MVVLLSSQQYRYIMTHSVNVDCISISHNRNAWNREYRDRSRYVPSQWETSLQCNNVSHWLGTYLDWSLGIGQNSLVAVSIYRPISPCIGIPFIKLWNHFNIDAWVQERRNSSAVAMELRLSCTSTSIWRWHLTKVWPMNFKSFLN